MKKITLAFISAMLCATGAQAQQPDCSLKQIASLPITTTAHNVLAVPLKINGTERLFALNLGSSITGVTGDFIDDQKLETEVVPGHIMFSFFDSVFTDGAIGHITHQTTIADVQIGSAEVKSMPMLDIPAHTSADGISGFLGTNVLKHFDVEIDLKNSRMNLYSPDHCPGKVVYWANDYTVAPLVALINSGKIVTQMNLDGRTLNVALALSPGHGLIGLWVVSALLDLPRETFEINPVPSPSYLQKDTWRYPFKSLSIGALSIANPEIDVIKEDEDCGHYALEWPPKDIVWGLCSAAMLVSRDELSKFHLYFAFGEGKLYLTPADAHK